MFTVTPETATSLSLQGPLTLDESGTARKMLLSALNKTGPIIELDCSKIEKLDTVGAMVLVQIKRTFPSLDLTHLSNDHASLFNLIERAYPQDRPAAEPPNPFRLFIERLGHGTLNSIEATKAILTFFGQVIAFFAKNCRNPQHFRMDSLARHIQETGIDAMPIVALVAFLISVVLAYQGAFQLRPLGAEIFTVNLIAVSVLREMAVLLTAIMIAGRSGSAFTAEIGVMKVNEEVDALSMIGIEPFDILVLPRIFALLITLPLLTFMADIVGLIGGGVTCAFVLDISFQQYWEQVRNVTQGTDFLVGMIKAPVFALIISIVGCKFGMQVSGSAESVGTYTTRSVVESIFIVLVADALFSVFFSKIGW